MIQKELFRTSVLIVSYGMMAMMEVDPTTGGPGKCPNCGNTEFKEDVWLKGYTGCTGCLEFHILTAHLKQIEEQYEETRPNR